MKIEEIKVVVESEQKDLHRDLDKTKKELKDVDKQIKDIEKSLKIINNLFKGLGNKQFATSVKQASTAFEVAKRSADTLNRSINNSTNNISKATREAQKLVNTLNGAKDVNATVSTGAGIGTAIGAGAIGAGIASAGVKSQVAGTSQTVSAELDFLRDQVRAAADDMNSVFKKSFVSIKEAISPITREFNNAFAGNQFQRILHGFRSMGDGIKNSSSDINKTFKDLKANIKVVGKDFKEYTLPQINNYGKAVIKATQEQRKMNKEMKASTQTASKMSSTFKNLVKTMLAFAGVGTIWKGIQADMVASENANLFARSFGEYTEEMRAFTNNALQDFAMTQSEAMKVASSFNFMIANVTGNKEEAKEMSKAILQMTVDFASLFNQTTERSAMLIRQALSGEGEALKEFGIIINEANIKNYAYANGIAVVGAELTETQKIMARYGSFMAQAGIANGDFAATINSPANQLKILQAQLRRTMELIGQAFRPITTIVLPILNALVSGLNKVIEVFAMFMSALFGVSMTITTSVAPQVASGVGGIAKAADEASGSLDGAGSAAKKAIKEFKGLMGFDELNILPSTETGGASGSGAGAGGVDGGSISTPTIEWSQTQEQAVEIPKFIQDLADEIRALAEAFFEPFKKAWDKVGPALISEIKKSWDSIKKIFSAAKETISAIWRNGGSDIFQNVIETILNIGVIAGRVFNEILVPIIEGFINLFNPEKNPWAQPIIDAFVWITEKVKDLTSWMAGDGFAFVEAFIVILGSLKLATWLVTGAMAIWNGVVAAFAVVSAVASAAGSILTAVIGFITAPVTLTILAIAGLIAIGYLLISNWDWIKEAAINCWIGIQEWWAGVSEWFLVTVVEPVKEFFSGLWSNIKEWGINAWEGVVEIWGKAKQWFDDTFITPLSNAFQTLGNGMKSFFENPLEAIKNMFRSTFNWISDKMNVVIDGLNKVQVPDWVPLVGGKGINIPRVPRLAKGGIVNSGQMYVAGEAGKEAIVPLEHNTQWARNIGQLVAKELGGAQSNQNDRPIEVILQVGATQMGRVVIDSINKVQAQEGRILLNI